MAELAAQVQEPVNLLKLNTEEAITTIAGRALALASKRNRRIMLGIVGGPGSGKSRFAEQVIGTLNKLVDGSAQRIPTDGFLFPLEELEARGLDERIGSPETYRAKDLVRFLKRLLGATGDVRGPTYSRKTGKVLEDSFNVGANVPILVAEGNYLLMPEKPWADMAALFDLSIFLRVERDIVAARLQRRAAEGRAFAGKHGDDYVEAVELPLFDRVSASAARADTVLEIGDAT